MFLSCFLLFRYLHFPESVVQRGRILLIPEMEGPEFWVLVQIMFSRREQRAWLQAVIGWHGSAGLGVFHRSSVGVVSRQALIVHCVSFVPVLILVWIIRAVMDMFRHPGRPFGIYRCSQNRPSGLFSTMRSPAMATAVSSKAVVQ